MSDVKHTVMEKISRGDLTMRPRWHFVVASSVAMFALFLLAFWLVYLESLIIFFMQGTGVAYVPVFGVHGVLVFLYSLPWLLVLLTAIFVYVIQRVMHRYAFCYSRPMVLSIVALIGFSMLGALMLAKSELHYTVLERVKERPVLGMVYRQYGLKPHQEVHIGTIGSTTNAGFILESRTGEIYQVLVSDRTRSPRERLELGETVLILGAHDAGTIEARGIKRFEVRHIQHRLQRDDRPLPLPLTVPIEINP